MRHRSLHFSATLGALLAVSSLAHSQALVRELPGRFANGRFGESLAGGFDLDGDGVPDALVGIPGVDTGVGVEGGRAAVYSGATGALLVSLTGFTIGGQYGFSADVLGDVSGDGSIDFVVGGPTDSVNGMTLGTAKVASGAGGFPFATQNGEAPGHDFGWSVSSAGDVNGDGTNDYIVGAPRADFAGNRSGSAYVFCGATHDRIYRFDGAGSFHRFGVSVADAGDFDGDGRDDVIVGASQARINGSTTGAAYVYSGLDGSLIRRIDGGLSFEGFGGSVAAAGDVNGDGLDDVIVGAPFADLGQGSQGRAVVVAGGPAGPTLFTFEGTQPDERMGLSVRGGSDADGDGTPDLLVTSANGQGSFFSGTVRVFSGATGATLLERSSTEDDPFDRFAFAANFAGDLNGDGKDDVLVGAPRATSALPTSGRVDVLLSGAALPASYCFAAANSTGIGARIGGTGAPSIGLNDFALRVEDAPAGRAGLFFYGPTRILAFTGDGFRCVGGSIARLAPALPIEPDGTVERALDFTSAPLSSGPRAILPGSTWNFQFWYRDPGGPFGTGINFSDALEVAFVN